MSKKQKKDLRIGAGELLTAVLFCPHASDAVAWTLSEEHIGSTLEVWCCQPGLLMPLKPREVLGVIAPGELLELLCS